MTVGVDVGGTHIRIGTFSDSEENEVWSCNTQSQVNELPQVIADFCKGKPITAIGVGIPGTLDRECRKILNTPNIPQLTGRELATEIEQASGVPVFMENDTVVLLIGDAKRLQLPERGVILGVYIGTGLGSCVLINGVPYKGKNGFGSELGHVPLLGKTAKCGCGNYGCAEAYVSGSYLQKLRAEKYPDTHISDIFTVMEELDEYADTLAVTVAGAVQILDPDSIILGGGVAEMKNFPLAQFKSRLYEHTMKPYPAETLNIISEAAEPEFPAGVYGAIIYADKQLR
jgi:allose kinase